MKKIPNLWWDYEWDKGAIVRIVVESDHPRYPIVKTYSTIVTEPKK